MISEEELNIILKENEGPTLEYKVSLILGDANKVAKLMTAFSNTQGGKLIIGIKDDKTFENFETKTEHEEHIMNIARNNIEPPIIPKFDIVEHSNGKVYIIDIPRFVMYPHAAKIGGRKTYYIRVGSTIREPTPEELRALFIVSKKDMKIFRELDIENFLRIGDSNKDSSLRYRTYYIYPKFEYGTIFNTAERKVEEFIKDTAPSRLFYGYPRPMLDGIRFIERDEIIKINYAQVNDPGLIYFFEDIGVHEQGISIERVANILKQFLFYSSKLFEKYNFKDDLNFIFSLEHINNLSLSANPQRVLDNIYLVKEENIKIKLSFTGDDLIRKTMQIIEESFNRFLLAFGCRIEKSIINKIINEI